MSRCVQCDDYLETYGELEPNTNMVGEAVHKYVYICKNAKCPNYGLLQTGDEIDGE